MAPRSLVLGLTSLAVALTLTACTGGSDPELSPGSSSSPTVGLMESRAFTLRPGHCWFEPIRVQGVKWEVEPADQFGWGDGVRRWKGTGELRQVAEDHLLFVDDKGRRIDLWLSGHPNVGDDGQAAYCL